MKDRRHRWIEAGAAVTVALLLVACGGDDAGTGASDASSTDGTNADAGGTDTGGDDGITTDTGVGDDATGDDAAVAGVGTATVTVDGVTMLFEQIEPGPDDDYFTFCTRVAGTLQAVFPQVDEAGNVLTGELSVILIEPGSLADSIEEPPEFSVHNGERFWSYADPDPFDIPANGRSASGTATLVESGAMDPQTGEIETTPSEASLEISC